MNLHNPIEFEPGTFIADWITGVIYEVMKHGRGDMVTLKNQATSKEGPWNGCNNPRFFAVPEGTTSSVCLIVEASEYEVTKILANSIEVKNGKKHPPTMAELLIEFWFPQEELELVEHVRKLHLKFGMNEANSSSSYYELVKETAS